MRFDAEHATDHPVFKAFLESWICRTFARDEVRERMIPAYMGLSKQIDHQKGWLFAAILEWVRRHHCRITMPPETVEIRTAKEPDGILIRVLDEADYEETYDCPFVNGR